jgi:hypothetical protein
MNQEVIVGLIILLAVGFILAKLVGGTPHSKTLVLQKMTEAHFPEMFTG